MIGRGFWLRSVWGALALMLAAPLAFSADAPKAVMAYYEGGISYGSLHEFSGYLTQLSTDSFAIDAKGQVSGSVPPNVLKFARSKGLQTFATVSNWGNGNFRSYIARRIITHPAVSAVAIQNMLTLVEAEGYTGINLDFEAVPHHERRAFTAFVRALSQAMRNAGYLTVISVPAEVKDDPGDSWAGAFDFKKLGASADLLQLMTYDENGPWGPPGPVAGLDWVEACVRFAVSVVPSDKISLGMPAYGYDWNVRRGGGWTVYWKQIPALLARTGAVPQWDSTSSSPYFTYTSSGGENHVVWYENTESIPLKSQLAVEYDLAGISVYALGFEDLSYWQAVDVGLGTEQADTSAR